MTSLTARTTRRGGFADDGLSGERALTWSLNGVRCGSTACIDVGSTTETVRVDAERPA